MYKTVHGDLITLAEHGEFDVIFHGCNCFHAMGGGIAKQLAERYPQVEESDKKTEFGDRNKLGYYSRATVHRKDPFTGSFLVFNVYTQYYCSHGKDVFEYDSFQKFLNDEAESMKIYYECWSSSDAEPYYEKIKYGLPQIGAGLAGGDWERISKMIEKFAEDVKDYADVTVVIYKP